MSFIVLDIETTGLDPKRHSMVSLGAVDYTTGDEFYMECRVEPGISAFRAATAFKPAAVEIDPFAMAVNGFTREQVTDLAKPVPYQVYDRFVDWMASRPRLLAGQQIGAFDIAFLHEYAGGKSVFEKTFSHRSVDLHSVAFAALGESLSLDGILKAVGLAPEPKPHNALTGARLEAQAFRLLLGAPKCSCQS